MEILLATANPGKARELQALLANPLVRFRTTQDFPGHPEVEETGDTYAHNATLKARVWAERTGLITLADDSGLEVAAMDGRPGVHSSRYAATNDARIAGILQELEGVAEPRRLARFVCVMALVHPNGSVWLRRGQCEGRIALAPSGAGGFGYDPIFLLPDRGQTMADISEHDKNHISHRGRAARAMAQVIASLSQDRRSHPIPADLTLP